jgi:Rrf2 family protein
MILRNQVEWALHCAVVLAGLPAGKTLSTKALAEFHGVPKEYLSKALQSLATAGLITGTLGPKGGYLLAKPPSKVSFLDIVEAVEGKDGNFKCTEIRGNNPCRNKSHSFSAVCIIARTMYGADAAWRKALRQTTLADVLAQLPREVPADLGAKSGAWLSERMGEV